MSQTIVVCPQCDARISLVDMLSVAPNSEVDQLHTRGMEGETWASQTGETIAHFRLDKLLGKGGFGVVYQAYDLQLNRTVAVKLPKVSAMTRLQADIFICEAQVAAQLKHPNIVSVHEIGRVADRVFIVSELIEGVTLKDWRLLENPDQQRSAKIVSQIARALHVAHAAGIVHRDVKPGNIIVDVWHSPHVTDFGLAKSAVAHDSPFKSGQVVGTTAYMSPEQGLGESESIDHRADIYSLGVVLYELLTGKRPVEEGSSPHEEAQSPKALLPTIPDDLSSICMKAISKRPSQRFQSCAELADELDRFCEGMPTKTLPPTKVQTAVRRVKRNSRYITLAAIGFLLGAAIIGFILVNTEQNSSPAPVVPSDGQYFVEVAVSRPGCTVKAVKVDSKKMRIDYANVVELESVPSDEEKHTFKTSLSPGWHIFEVVAPNGDIAEVWRLVPDDLSQTSNGQFRSTDWTKNGTHGVTLQPIPVLPAETIDYVKCVGQTFESGDETAASASTTRPLEKIQMYDFWIAPYEVSLTEFIEVQGRTPYEFNPTQAFEEFKDDSDFDNPDQFDDFPFESEHNMTIEEINDLIVNGFPESTESQEEILDEKLVATHVSFLEALEYTERVGGRLPTFEEYLFAATNGGTTIYPWGDRGIFDEWKIGQIGTPKMDVTENGVRNLFSNVGEWTCDVTMPFWYYDKGPTGKHADSSRLVVGGAQMLQGQVLGFDPSDTPRRTFHQETVGKQSCSPYLGFRVYRSTKPRLDKNSDVIKYYIRNQSNLPKPHSVISPIQSEKE